MQTDTPLSPDAQVLAMTGAEQLTIPDGGWILQADFIHMGSDLLVVGQGGQQILIPDYFMTETPPNLATAFGSVLPADLVAKLAGPANGVQFAQASPAAATEAIGRIDTLSGTVEVTRTDGSKQTLNQGSEIFSGDVIETGDGSAVGIVLADDSTVSLADNGRMVMDELVYNPDQEDGNAALTIVQGVFSFVSGNIAKTGPGAMVLRTPTATIGIRGTTVAGRAAPEGQQSTFSLLPDPNGDIGEVLITNGAGTVILNLPGATTNLFSATQAPAPPIIVPVQEIQAQFSAALNSLPPSPIFSAPAGNQGGNDGDTPGDGDGGDGPGDGPPGDAPPEGEGDGPPEGEGELPPEGELAEGELPPEGELLEGEGDGPPEGLPGDGDGPPEGLPGDGDGEFGPLGGDGGAFGPLGGGDPFGADPFGGNPFGGNPFAGDPFGGDPFGGDPFAGDPFGDPGGEGDPFGLDPLAGDPLFETNFDFFDPFFDPLLAEPEFTETELIDGPFIDESTNTANFIGSTGSQTFETTPGDNMKVFMSQEFGELGGTDTLKGSAGIDELILQDANDILFVFDATSGFPNGKIDYTSRDGSVTGTINLTSLDFLRINDGSTNFSEFSDDDTGIAITDGGTSIQLDMNDGTANGFAYLYIGSNSDDFSTNELNLSDGTDLKSVFSSALPINHTVTNGNVEGAIILGKDGNDTIVGTSAGDIIFGGTGQDDITVGDDDEAYGGAENDTITITSASTNGARVYGGGGNDSITINAASNNIEVDGGAGTADTLVMNGATSVSVTGVESISGSSGNDTITVTGSVGATILGKDGQDTMTGGSGDDTFRYTAIGNSTVGNGDIITNFNALSSGETLLFDGILSGLFSLLADHTVGFTNNGNTQARFNDGSKLLELDTDGNGFADMEITLQNVSATDLDETDFSLTPAGDA